MRRHIVSQVMLAPSVGIPRIVSVRNPCMFRHWAVISIGLDWDRLAAGHKPGNYRRANIERAGGIGGVVILEGVERG